MAKNTDPVYDFDSDDELYLISEIDELALAPDDSEIGIHGMTSTLQKPASSGSTSGPSSSARPTLPDAPPAKKKKTRIVQENPAISLGDIIPDGVGLLREAMLSNSKVMTTPAGKHISVIRECVNSQPDDNLLPMAEHILEEVWEVTERGNKLTVGRAANSAMWKSFHKLRLKSELTSKWIDFLKETCQVLDVSDFISNMLLQEALNHFLHAVVTRRNVTPKKSDEKEMNFTVHDQEVLRYVAGFVPYALSKRYRRLQPSKTVESYLAFLENMRVSQDKDTHADSFLEYTCVWTTLQNRGGLFCVSDDWYILFRALELATRKHLNDDLLVGGRSQPVKEKLCKELASNVFVQRMWEKLQGNELTNGQKLFTTIINYWVEIRMRAIIKMFMDKKRQESGIEKREKGLRKKLQKKK